MTVVCQFQIEEEIVQYHHPLIKDDIANHNSSTDNKQGMIFILQQALYFVCTTGIRWAVCKTRVKEKDQAVVIMKRKELMAGISSELNRP